MSKYNETILTNSGLDLASRAANGKTKFTITKATSTADDLTTMSESDLQKLTSLPNEIQTGSITNQDENISNSNSVIGTEILFTNQGIDKGYSVNAVGLYAKEDGKDEEILYALNTAIEPEFMPDFADQVLLQFKITMYVIVGRAENVTVIIDPSGMASKDYVNTKIAEIDVNDKIQDNEIDKKLQNKLVYTDNKSKDKNAVTQIAEAIGSAVYGFKTIDKGGNVTSILPDADSLVTLPGEWNNNSGGSTDPDHPAAGVDIYPGSLAKGEITERYCLWQGESKPTEVTNVTFSQDVGSKMDKVGEGLTYLFHIQRTAITKGLKGEVTKIEFNYDPNNYAKDGYFTTTSPVPAYIKVANLKVDEEQVITFNGIGENLTTIKNHQSPGIGFTFKADKTMDIRPIQGFDNDGAADGITGYTYDVIVEAIANYSTQNAVQQLPSGINLFSGSARGAFQLNGSTNFFENVGDGIQVTIGKIVSVASKTGSNEARDITSNVTLNYSDFKMNIPKTFVIKKEDLIVGEATHTLSTTLSDADIKKIKRSDGKGIADGMAHVNYNNPLYFISNSTLESAGEKMAIRPFFLIEKNGLLNNSIFYVEYDTTYYYSFGFTIESVKTYTEV